MYTWVNGSDPAWRQRYEDYLNIDEIKLERYVGIGEIYLSLGSVFTFVPWVRKVYIITQSQQLDLSVLQPELRSRVEIVDPATIMPSSALPTYSSLAIESCMHNIPGLSENFIYLNDDVLFWKDFPKREAFTADGRFKAVGKNTTWLHMSSVLTCCRPFPDKVSLRTILEALSY